MFAIGDASRQSGVSIETIRYYEREGIVPKADRTASGRRVYDHNAIVRLRFIRRCRDHGFSIADTRELMSLIPDSDTACSQVVELSARHLQDVRRKIEDLQQLEIALARLAGDCGKGHPTCPMLDALTQDPDRPA